MAKARQASATRTLKKKSARAAAPRGRTVSPPPANPNQERFVPAAASAAPRKPAYYEAISLYESGVRGLQRHDYEAAAAAFRSVLERYPEERELHERARLYLRVCERETARRPSAPQTPQERVYAATVALNAGDHAVAMEHLRRALDEAPESDHAHYIMAVALATRGQTEEALEHLRQAISLNPENRALARQEPDFESLRERDDFREVLDTPPAPRRRPRPRR